MRVRGRLYEVPIPRRYRVSNKVSPCMGLPLSACRTPGPVHALLGPYRPAHDLSGIDGRLARVDLPADDLAAVAIGGTDQPSSPSPPTRPRLFFVTPAGRIRVA